MSSHYGCVWSRGVESLNFPKWHNGRNWYTVVLEGNHA